VTKGVCGSPEIAAALVESGVTELADSRIANLCRMREAGIDARYLLLRSPKMSEIRQVVDLADVSLNTEMSVVRRLARQAVREGKVHGIIWMVELGDRREGLPESGLPDAVRETLSIPGVEFTGIGTNLACFSGVKPDQSKMEQLSQIAANLQEQIGAEVRVVSAGNSANYQWMVSAADIGRVNHLRIGEAILLGRETLYCTAIPGLHTDAFTLVAEVIECQKKPSNPDGEIAHGAFGHVPQQEDRGRRARTILALGEQDAASSAIQPRIQAQIVGASSDHLVLDTGQRILEPGSEVSFDLQYEALLRAMTSPYVRKVYL
jgi:predicted amino acid racemase